MRYWPLLLLLLLGFLGSAHAIANISAQVDQHAEVPKCRRALVQHSTLVAEVSQTTWEDQIAVLKDGICYICPAYDDSMLDPRTRARFCFFCVDDNFWATKCASHCMSNVIWQGRYCLVGQGKAVVDRGSQPDRMVMELFYEAHPELSNVTGGHWYTPPTTSVAPPAPNTTSIPSTTPTPPNATVPPTNTTGTPILTTASNTTSNTPITSGPPPTANSTAAPTPPTTSSPTTRGPAEQAAPDVKATVDPTAEALHMSTRMAFIMVLLVVVIYCCAMAAMVYLGLRKRMEKSQTNQPSLLQKVDESKQKKRLSRSSKSSGKSSRSSGRTTTRSDNDKVVPSERQMENREPTQRSLAPGTEKEIPRKAPTQESVHMTHSQKQKRLPNGMRTVSAKPTVIN
ncbi:unnamed protein product, partial [Mesorhabditis spiculigera]